MKIHSSRPSLIFIVTIVLALGSPCLRAQTITTWTGTGANANWSNGQNWASGVGWASGDQTIFSGTTNLFTTNDTTVDNAAKGIVFNAGAGAFTLSGNEILLHTGTDNNASITNNSTSTETINLNLQTTNTAILTVNTVGNVAINGAILPSGGSNTGITKLGTGTLTLSGSNNTANGGAGSQLNIHGGTVIEDFTTNTPVSTISNLTFTNNSTLILNGNSSQAATVNVVGPPTQPFSINSPSLSTIIFKSNGGPGVTLAGTTLTTAGFAGLSTLFVNTANGGTLTFSGAIAAAQGGESNGIYPCMVVQNSGGIGFGTSTQSGSGTIQRYSAATTLPSDPGSTTTTNYITSGSITIVDGSRGVGINSLQIDTSSGTGSMFLNNTELNIGASTSTGSALLMTGGSNYTISGSGGFAGVAQNAANGVLYVHQYGSGTLTLGVEYGGSVNTLNLVKDGTGALVVTSANVTTGATYVDQGSLMVNGSIASSTMTINAGGTLGGSGLVAAISGSGGMVAPGVGGTPSILTAAALTGTGAVNFDFLMTNAVSGSTSSPIYSNSSASGNDLLHLTGATPFAVTLNSGDTITVNFTGMTLMAGDIIQGGFYTDQGGDFLSSFSGATFNYVGLESGFTVSQVTTAQESANFAGGTQDGFVSEFVIAAVPEPSEMALLLIGGLAAGAILISRRSNA